MAGNAFTAGVKPGGLTTSTEIRILLCYLIQHAGTPLSQGELETALLGEELVNYFELASNLSDLLEQGFVREENGRYTILPAGADIAEALADDVPRSVRDAAVRATLAAQQFARKEAQHHAQITPAASGTGYNVQCSIRDMETDFQNTLARCRTVEATLQSVWQGKKLLHLAGILLKFIAPLV